MLLEGFYTHFSKLLTFNYFIKWFIDKFGFLTYLLLPVTIVFSFCIYTMTVNFKNKEFDRVVMIFIFAVILLGGMIGIGIESYKGYF